MFTSPSPRLSSFEYFAFSLCADLDCVFPFGRRLCLPPNPHTLLRVLFLVCSAPRQRNGRKWRGQGRTDEWPSWAQKQPSSLLSLSLLTPLPVVRLRQRDVSSHAALLFLFFRLSPLLHSSCALLHLLDQSAYRTLSIGGFAGSSSMLWNSEGADTPPAPRHTDTVRPCFAVDLCQGVSRRPCVCVSLLS